MLWEPAPDPSGVRAARADSQDVYSGTERPDWAEAIFELGETAVNSKRFASVDYARNAPVLRGSLCIEAFDSSREICEDPLIASPAA